MIYEYICDTCGVNFETQQSIKDDAYTICPDCGKETLRRVLSIPHIFIKQGYSDIRDVRLISERNIKDIGPEKYQEMVAKYGKKKPTADFGKTAGATPQQLRQMTNEQRLKYIETGEIKTNTISRSDKKEKKKERKERQNFQKKVF
jgi:putative FmdB family regulatory protein